MDNMTWLTPDDFRPSYNPFKQRSNSILDAYLYITLILRNLILEITTTQLSSNSAV